MARTHQAYPPEIRQQMVELVQSGTTPQELAREYEPSAGSIRNWVAQHERDGGQRSDGLSTDERLELRRLPRENKQLRTERDIPKKQWLGSRGRATRSPRGIRVRRGQPSRLAGAHHVSGAGSLPQRLLRMAAPRAVGTSAPRCAVDRADQGDLERQLRSVRAARTTTCSTINWTATPAPSRGLERGRLIMSTPSAGFAIATLAPRRARTSDGPPRRPACLSPRSTVWSRSPARDGRWRSTGPIGTRRRTRRDAGPPP